MATGTQGFLCLFVLNFVSRICLKAEAGTLWSGVGSNLLGQSQPLLRDQTLNKSGISLRVDPAIELVITIPTRFITVMCWNSETIGYLKGSLSQKEVLESVRSLSWALHKAKQNLTYVSRGTHPKSAQHLYLNQPPCVCGCSCLRLRALEYLSDANFPRANTLILFRR